MPPDSLSPNRTLLDLFRTFAGSNKEYIVHDNGYRSWTYTYEQLAGAAYGFAERLDAAGLRKGDRLLLWAENSPEWIAVFWGCVLRGVVIVPIDYQRSPGFVFHIHEIVQARAVVARDETEAFPSSMTNVWRISDVSWNSRTPSPPANPDAGDLVEIVFTSGATGDPKGVLLTHRNILANLTSPDEIVRRYGKYAWPLRPLRFLSLIPLSHMFGQMLTLFVLPLIPASAVLMRGLQPEEIARQLRRRHVTALIAVPKILDLLRQDVLHRFSEATQPDSAHWTRRWLHFRRIHRHFGWRFWAFISGGAPLSLDTEDFWRKLGFPVIQGYGLTETAPIVAFNNPFAIQRGSAGAVVAGTDVRLAEDGEILVRGANVSSGYWNAPADAEQAFRDGWFHTGDIGEWDAQGHLLIRGRKKEWIVLPDGQKVFPDDVERILLQIPGVLEAAIVGRDHVHAVLVLDASKDPDDIASKANSRLESHQRIHQVSIWPQPSLPRTEATHKIKRAAIQKWLDSGVLTPATVKDSANLVDIVRQHAPGRSVSGDTTLDDLGLSSLERVELLVDLEQHLGARLEEAALAGTSTVNALQTLPAAGDSSEFPVWNRTLPARSLRRALLTPFLLPLAKLAAHITVSGHEHFARLDGPVIFASNHQSHLDTPVILAALPSIYRHRTAVAMWKEYFDAHFSPSGFSRWRWLTNTVSYFLATSLFNGFPLPQTEAGASQSLRYIGELVSDGWSILYFPEGERTESGEVGKFQPGIGFLASRLRIPVVPIRLTGVDRVLHRGHRLPQPGPVRIAFGAPVKLEGNDFANLAERIRSAVLAI